MMPLIEVMQFPGFFSHFLRGLRGKEKFGVGRRGEGEQFFENL